MMKNKNNK